MKRNDADDFATPFEDLPLFRQEQPQGPFSRSRVAPTREEALVAGLIWRHKGRANPVSIARITELTGVCDREVKEIAASLVITHRMRVGALRGDVSGYFVIEDAEDLRVATKALRGQIIAMAKRLAVLESAHAVRELLGQMRLED